MQITPSTDTYHVPVLLHPSVDSLQIRQGGTYVDVTFGGGGHSSEILGRLQGEGKLFAFDQDTDAERHPLVKAFIENDAQRNPAFTFIRSNFRYLTNWMDYHHVSQIDGLLADLGVSSHHLDESSRGFAFRHDSPIDMRMNTQSGKTAADILNSYDPQRLKDILHLYGDLKHAGRIAQRIVSKRETSPILTTGQLADCIRPVINKAKEKKELAQVFQALRIEVNDEMQALEELLNAATHLLKPGGRIAIITYHSIEDRIVKNILKTGNKEGRIEKDFYGNILTPYLNGGNKIITPQENEIQTNPRSRSAKLRIAQKK